MQGLYMSSRKNKLTDVSDQGNVQPSAENKAAYKKQGSNCLKLRKKSIRRYWIKFQKKLWRLTKDF